MSASPAAPKRSGRKQVVADAPALRLSSRFIIEARRPEQFPATPLPECAFAGRSNCGKSSLLNAVVGRRDLARSSALAGRTRGLVFFTLSTRGEDRLLLADLPGYGYAHTHRATIQDWQALRRVYFEKRPNLQRVFLLIDSRRGLMPQDHEMITHLSAARLVFQLVLTKADRVKASELEAAANACAQIASRPPAHPLIVITSSRQGQGIAALRQDLEEIAGYSPARGSSSEPGSFPS